MTSQKPRIVTHNGDFHADDIFAVASLKLFLSSDFDVVRTRESDLFATGDYVVDVGGVHDPALNRFDHHQIGGAGERDNGIPYASFGLVWKKFGEKICGKAEIAHMIDQKLVSPIDATDNGIEIYDLKNPEIQPYLIEHFFASYRPTWKERDADMLSIFLGLVDSAALLIQREVKRAEAKLEARNIVEKAYETSEDKRLIVLDKDYPWHDALNAFPEPLFVVHPENTNGKWYVAAVRVHPGSFENRRDLPLSWAGKRDLDLARETGVSDAVFCHNKRFLAVAKSREGAIALAKLALLQTD